MRPLFKSGPMSDWQNCDPVYSGYLQPAVVGGTTYSKAPHSVVRWVLSSISYRQLDADEPAPHIAKSQFGASEAGSAARSRTIRPPGYYFST